MNKKITEGTPTYFWDESKFWKFFPRSIPKVASKVGMPLAASVHPPSASPSLCYSVLSLAIGWSVFRLWEWSSVWSKYIRHSWSKMNYRKVIGSGENFWFIFIACPDFDLPSSMRKARGFGILSLRDMHIQFAFLSLAIMWESRLSSWLCFRSIQYLAHCVACSKYSINMYCKMYQFPPHPLTISTKCP